MPVGNPSTVIGFCPGVQVGIGVTTVSSTAAGNAVACATSQACLYAIVAAPSAMDAAGANPGEVKVAVSSGTLTHANCLLQGRSLGIANYEGIVVPVTNTNQLRFGSTGANSVKVFAVVAL